MAKKTEQEKRGRPKAKIDWDRVNAYLQAGCDGASIARMIGVHYNTFYEAVKAEFNCNFSEYSQQKKEEGKTLLKYTMFSTAMQGNPAMMIFLSKQEEYLGYKDRVDNKTDLSVNGGLAVQWNEEKTYQTPTE